MENLQGKVAVVTGAASGIGFALAERFAREGMKVVLADIEQGALDAAVQTLRRAEHDVIGVMTDVARPEAVDALARQTIEAYGKVNVVCNNAGVISANVPIWEASVKDWQWMLGVNLWGVINGIRSFIPLMLKQDEEGYVINTASQAGLVYGNSIYGITKHSVVALSETLYAQLQAQNANVGVSVLCPILVDTKIVEAERNRPEELWNADAPEEARGWEFLAQRLREVGISPEEQAEIVLQGLKQEQFYIFPQSFAD
ncbi:MAG TPA: SDR family NAD(P)-dependent oxidoreductase, partial [Dehalococcoidia bacterium]|nr:SDR family NAD(P)-dependent oxidoreductase [Dehalococcoidia bacterium]